MRIVYVGKIELVLIKITYISLFIRYIVGELEFMEGDDLLHPLLPGGGAVRVDVHPLRHLSICLSSHYPTAEQET